MVDTKTTLIIAALTAVGGMYITSQRAAAKMCSNVTAFNTQMATFAAGCPTTPPSTFDVMKYFVL